MNCTILKHDTAKIKRDNTKARDMAANYIPCFKIIIKGALIWSENIK